MGDMAKRVIVKVQQTVCNLFLEHQTPEKAEFIPMPYRSPAIPGQGEKR